MAPLSLKQLAIRGTAWTLIGYGLSQVVRLGSNLVLTRLLVPEMFGVMALVNTFMVGLQMFSDVGIGPNIIQDKRGDEPKFLNTAWTIQVCRGFALWGCACIGAIPFSAFYQESQLAWIIPVSGFTAVISGFNSTAIFTANRHLNLSRLTLLEIISQSVAVTVMITWGLINPSVWALVVGGLVGSSVKMLMSHFWLSGIPNRLFWDAEMAKVLVRFGRWIFISTVLGFLLRYIDRIVLGKFLTLSELGVYSIAVIFSGFIEQVYTRISQKVLFPLYSRLKELPRNELRKRVRKVRISIMAALLPPLCILVIFGSDLVQLLFDPRYQNAGWMLQVLAAGWIVPISTVIGPFYLAFGNSFLYMNLAAIRMFVLIASMVAGGIMFGTNGVIFGVAIADAVFYPFLVLTYHRYSLWIPYLDAIGIVSSGAVVFAGLYFTGQLG